MTSILKIIVGLAICGIAMPLNADNTSSHKAIEAQVVSASDCVQLAYATPIEGHDKDRIFKSCVSTRAILIAMIKKYGAGNKGEIDIIDKLEAYSYLANSTNSLVKQEANRYVTAAGTK